jgi:hypothetical protein
MRNEERESGEKWRNGQPWESWVEGWFDVRICWQLNVSERASEGSDSDPSDDHLRASDRE